MDGRLWYQILFSLVRTFLGNWVLKIYIMQLSHFYCLFSGMMNCRPGKPFPPKDQIGDFLSQSKNGVVFMSFGSVIKPSAMPKEYKQIILNVFARFPQYDFIWKWDEKLPEAPKNVLGKN